MTVFSNYFGRLFYSEESSHAHTSEELKSLLDISAEGGDIEVETKDMISSIFEFGETRVKEIMVPRIDIVSIDIDTDVNGLLTLVQESEHSRIPVYEENIDQIRGIVYAKDLLNHVFLEGKKDESITSLSKDAYFVPESKMIDDLLKELQRESVHMAIVVDEYGGTAGLVTMEDILEEIVGEIQDEYDVEEEMYQKLDENAYLVDGKLDIDDLSDLIGTEIEGEGFETVAGLIYQAIGRIPHQGEEVLVDDIRFSVSKVIGKRIAKIKVIRLPENQKGEEEEE
jgi:CBS domain containing-hemolysin-like protein